MSCYHPLIAVPAGVDQDGKKHMRIVHPKGRFELLDFKKFVPDGTLVPCGKCIGCRLDYSRRWADRMMMELCDNPKAMFLTLTYDDLEVPVTYDGVLTLCKRDLQLFMKRLRKNYPDIKFRYFASGEYGDVTHRPHYHMILYGISLDDFTIKQIIGYNNLKQPYFSVPSLLKIWSKGHILCTDVSYETCAYVARYVSKKAQVHYDPSDYGAQPEFSLMSRRPGIGMKYLESHPDLFDSEYINLPNGRKACIPRLFLDSLPAERKDVILLERQRLASDSTLRRLQMSDLSQLDQLAVRERDAILRTKVLSRTVE